MMGTGNFSTKKIWASKYSGAGTVFPIIFFPLVSIKFGSGCLLPDAGQRTSNHILLP